MIQPLLIFLILSANMFLGICWNTRLLSDNIPVKGIWLNIALSAGTGLLLCPFYSLNLFSIFAALALLTGITVISGILSHSDWKLVVFYTCLWLSALIFTDTLIYLLLVKSGSISQSIWLTLLLLLRLSLSYVVFRASGLLSRCRNWASHYRSTYGTSLVVFSGIVFLSYITITARTTASLPIVWLIMSAALFLRIVLAYSHIKYQQEKELLSSIALKNALLEKNYRAVNKAYSTNARLFHDFHRHLEILLQMTDRNQDREASNYIEKIIGPLRNISNEIWTGDETVDYIINSRYERAKEDGIRMEMNIEYPYNTNIQSNDLCTILSNLLDNAGEAAANPHIPGERMISLTIRRIQNILVIKLVNSSLPPQYASDGSYDTAKEDRTLHGWGMKNIESTVQKYDGIVQSSYKDYTFETIVTLSFDGVKIE